MNKCPNCGSKFYTPIDKFQKECIKCGCVFGEAKEKAPEHKEVLLG
jgi:transcription initiation factor TFIIIB Brf1 subunit/transcription initiation factor TFIIB